MFGRHRHASVTPFKWRSARGPVMARLYTLFPLINLNKDKKSQSLTPSDKTFWIRTWTLYLLL